MDKDPKPPRLSRRVKAAITIAAIIGPGLAVDWQIHKEAINPRSPRIGANPLTWIATPLVGGARGLGIKVSEQPSDTLTGIITDLEKGETAEVAAEDVKVPGPINEARGRPLVFKSGGKTYFAYSQGHEPNFSATAKEDAASMAIVEEPTADKGLPLTEAHLNGGVLVGNDQAPVGFSTGGDTGK